MKLSVGFVFTAVTAVARLVAATSVIEATDANIDELLSSGIPTVLDIYASWCGHCKTLSPIYDQLSELYDHAKGKIQFVKIDGDINRKIAKRYRVEYFPTLKFIDADGSTSEINERELLGLSGYVQKHAKIHPKRPVVAPSVVHKLDDANFEETIKGKNALVAFTASWCGHCKTLKPEYEKLAHVFERDSESLIIGGVDCTDGEPTTAIAKKYGVTGYPTILFFPADGSEPQSYNYGRKVEDLVEFLGSKGASQRNADGTLNAKAGVIAELDELVKTAISTDSAAAVDELIAAASKLSQSSAQVYEKVAQRFKTGRDYFVNKEVPRLAKLLDAPGKMNPKKLDELQVRFNILSRFVHTPEESVEDVDEDPVDHVEL